MTMAFPPACSDCRGARWTITHAVSPSGHRERRRPVRPPLRDGSAIPLACQRLVPGAARRDRGRRPCPEGHRRERHERAAASPTDRPHLDRAQRVLVTGPLPISLTVLGVSTDTTLQHHGRPAGTPPGHVRVRTLVPLTAGGAATAPAPRRRTADSSRAVRVPVPQHQPRRVALRIRHREGDPVAVAATGCVRRRPGWRSAGSPSGASGSSDRAGTADCGARACTGRRRPSPPRTQVEAPVPVQVRQPWPSSAAPRPRAGRRLRQRPPRFWYASRSPGQSPPRRSSQPVGGPAARATPTVRWARGRLPGRELDESARAVDVEGVPLAEIAPARSSTPSRRRRPGLRPRSRRCSLVRHTGSAENAPPVLRYMAVRDCPSRSRRSRSGRPSPSNIPARPRACSPKPPRTTRASTRSRALVAIQLGRLVEIAEDESRSPSPST